MDSELDFFQIISVNNFHPNQRGAHRAEQSFGENMSFFVHIYYFFSFYLFLLLKSMKMFTSVQEYSKEQNERK